MKTSRILRLIAFGLLAIPGMATSQIRDNDASQSVLAVQCAVSSGFSASDYEDYSRRLAKTLSLLSNDQQTRVFGYLPMPGAATLANDSGNGNELGANWGNVGSANADAQVSSPLGDGGTGPEVAATQSSPLLEAVAKFNSLFDGTAPLTSNPQSTASSQDSGASGPLTLASTVSAPTVGNTTTTNLPTGQEASTATTSNGTGSTPTSSTSADSTAKKPAANWQALMAWFEAAEAAYKAGTLSSFLKGGGN